MAYLILAEQFSWVFVHDEHFSKLATNAFDQCSCIKLIIQDKIAY